MHNHGYSHSQPPWHIVRQLSAMEGFTSQAWPFKKVALWILCVTGEDVDIAGVFSHRNKILPHLHLG